MANQNVKQNNKQNNKHKILVEVIEPWFQMIDDDWFLLYDNKVTIKSNLDTDIFYKLKKIYVKTVSYFWKKSFIKM